MWESGSLEYLGECFPPEAPGAINILLMTKNVSNHAPGSTKQSSIFDLQGFPDGRRHGKSIKWLGNARLGLAIRDVDERISGPMRRTISCLRAGGVMLPSHLRPLNQADHALRDLHAGPDVPSVGSEFGPMENQFGKLRGRFTLLGSAGPR